MCSFKSEGESSWEATFPWIYSRSSIWRAAACVSKEWIQHIINNWCASKHWRHAHMMRMYTFFSWMMHSLAESRQSADNFGQMEYYIFLFGLFLPWNSTGSLCRWKERTNLEMVWVIKRHVSNLYSVSREHRTAKHCSYPQEMNISLKASYNEVVKQAKTRHVQEYEFYIKGLQRRWRSRSKQTWCLN